MKVVFLCGGVGKRMFPITEDKFLIDFMGRTLFERQVVMARDAGLSDFIIIGNPSNIDRLRQLAAEITGVSFSFTVQQQARGIADALQGAAPLLDREILVVNPNDVFEQEAYRALLSSHAEKKACSYLLGCRVKQYFPGGYLAVDGSGRLTSIIEKPSPGTERGNLVNILLHLHTDTSALLRSIAAIKTTRDDAYECALDNLVRDGYNIQVVPYNGLWAPIKYPWHILDIARLLLDSSDKQIASSVTISDRAVISGNVILGENVRILENAVIRGPVYIGPNTVIGNNTLLREYSHIGADCVVGFSTEVKGSYIGNGCWFHSNYIGDSIIGDNCSFGAGAVTANFRFDEKEIKVRSEQGWLTTGRDHFGAIIGNNCKMGINSGILPGRRIGPCAIVGSHVCLDVDLAPGMIALVSPQYKLVRHEIKPNEAKIHERKKSSEI